MFWGTTTPSPLIPLPIERRGNRYDAARNLRNVVTISRFRIRIGHNLIKYARSALYGVAGRCVRPRGLEKPPAPKETSRFRAVSIGCIEGRLDRESVRG